MEEIEVPSDADLLPLINLIYNDLQQGIQQGQPGHCRCIPTRLPRLPTGQERGSLLLCDLGGTNLRVAAVEFEPSTGAKVLRQAAWSLESLQPKSGQHLFTQIARHIADLARDFPECRRLGFTFSFPFAQETLRRGRLLAWSKSWSMEDVVGEEVVSLLQAKLEAEQAHVQVCAIVNDTVATLLGAMMQQDCQAAVILGTGTNACFLHGTTIYNLEWGALPAWHPGKLDDALDLASINPGAQRFEKQVAALYLGQLYEQITGEERVDARIMSERRDGISAALTERSLRLVAAGIVAMARFAPIRRVAIDGSLYNKYGGYAVRLQEAVASLAKLLQLPPLELISAEGQSLFGAGVAVLLQ